MSQRLRTGAVVALLVTGFLTVVTVVVSNPQRAAALERSTVLGSAAAIGRQEGYRVGIAVYDTWRGRSYGSGDDTGTFASESVVKAMIATRLLVQGRMYGSTARRAWKMITRSDDAIATSFYGSVGGDGLINWIKRRYNVWNLGSPPSRSGWWGNTHITPRGLVRFYARVKRDRTVGPWLLNAMHHAKPYGSDGTYQFFGLPQASSGAAVKQGWGCDYGSGCGSADFNTTGFVDSNRYAVAILARGPLSTYGRPIASILTRTAKRLLPGGQFPEAAPVVRSLSTHTGRVAGGQRIALRGSGFTHVRAVLFGRMRGTAVGVRGPGRLLVTTPAHPAGRFALRVVTGHGTSPAGTVRFRFIKPAGVRSVTPSAGRLDGGTRVRLTGVRLGTAKRVLFGGTAGTDLRVISPTALSVTAPAHLAATVDIRVVTRYGKSPPRRADRYAYVARPTVTGVSPGSGPASGGSVVTITGTDLSRVSAVRFGDIAVSELNVTSPTSLTVVAPAHAPGSVDITVRSPGGTSAPTPADVFAYAA